MLFIRSFFLIVCCNLLLLSLPLSYAQDPFNIPSNITEEEMIKFGKLTSKQKSQLVLDKKIDELFIKMSQALQEDPAFIKSIQGAKGAEGGALSSSTLEILNTHNEKIFTEIYKNIKTLTESERAFLVKQHRRGFYWRKVVDLAKKLTKKHFHLKQWNNLVATTRSFARMSGLGSFIATEIIWWGAWMQTSFILAGAGHKTLAAVNTALPWYKATPFPFMWVRKKIREMRLKKMIGADVFNAYMKQQKVIQKSLISSKWFEFTNEEFFRLQNSSSNPEMMESIRLKRQNYLLRMKERFGWKSDLSYRQLVLFCEKHNIAGKYLETLKPMSMGEHYKLKLLLENILQTQDDTVLFILKQKFASNFVKIKKLPQWGHMRGWVHEMMAAKSWEEVMLTMERIPKEMAPKMFITIWEDLLFPHYTKEIKGWHYLTFRRMLEKFVPLKGELIITKEHSLTPKIKKHMRKFFDDSLPAKTRCNSSFVHFLHRAKSLLLYTF